MHEQIELAHPFGSDNLAVAPQDINCGFRNIVCMTLYNEPFPMLRTSLAALIRSLAFADRAPGASGAQSCIAIVADGADRIDPEVMAFLQQAGLIDTGLTFDALDEPVHYSCHDAQEILAALGDDEDGHVRITFAVCVKSRNCGKLHSHALFFQGICDVLAPEFCYQIDAGTVIGRDAIAELVRFMDGSPGVAAAASRILTAHPEPDASPTILWQYMDFVAQKAVVWPTEVASGYLSVIPGQFCVFRWAAIDQSVSHETGVRPVDSYLRGLHGGTPLERVMFLAEDRVFGNEIVLARDTSWSIGLCSKAEATTDACETFGELMRQRRRWQNSALAVRLWLWRRWPSYLVRDDKSIADKLRFSSAMLWQGVLTSSEIISPACVVLLLFAACVAALHGEHVAFTIASVAVVAGTAALMMLASRVGRPSVRRWLCRGREIGSWLSIGSLVAGTALFLPPLGAAALLAPPLILAAVIGATFRGKRWAVLRLLPAYLLIDRVISPVLYGYAVANVHDVSWGTKGLVTSAGVARAEKRRMRRLRNVVAGSIVGLNLALVAAGLSYRHLFVSGESSVIQLYSAVCLTVVGVAALAQLVWACQSLDLGRFIPRRQRAAAATPLATVIPELVVSVPYAAFSAAGTLLPTPLAAIENA